MIFNTTIMSLHTYSNLVEGFVVKRPSRYVKSPYVADVYIDNDDNGPQNTIICHAPSLGCSGMVNAGANVILEKIYDGNEEKKCVYKIIYVNHQNVIIGTNPYISNKLVFNMIKNNMIPNLTGFDDEFNYLKSEKKVGDSRIDIYGEKQVNGITEKYYIEIKTSPVKIENSDISIFPEGYRKSKKHTISERANKHLQELVKLKKSSEHTYCYIIFVVPRNDCNFLQPNKEDLEYCRCFSEAIKNGVKIIALSTFMEDNTIKFGKFLKVKFPFTIKK